MCYRSRQIISRHQGLTSVGSSEHIFISSFTTFSYICVMILHHADWLVFWSCRGERPQWTLQGFFKSTLTSLSVLIKMTNAQQSWTEDSLKMLLQFLKQQRLQLLQEVLQFFCSCSLLPGWTIVGCSKSTASPLCPNEPALNHPCNSSSH